MTNAAQITRLLSDLTKETSTGKLQWKLSEPPDSLRQGTYDVYPYYYETTYKGQTIGIAERRFQAYDGDADRSYWTMDVVLVFRDFLGRVTWDHRSNSSAFANLLDAVRDSAAGIDDILAKLVGEDDDEI